MKAASAARCEPSSWKRALYEKQPYKDTYYDGNEFLGSLQIVSAADLLPSRSWISAISFIAYTLSVPFTLSGVQYILRHQYLSGSQLFVAELSSSVGCWLLAAVVQYARSQQVDWELIRSWSLFFVIFRIAAPALRTLTLSFSDDTVQAAVIFLFFLYILLRRISSPNATFHSTGTLSMSAAIFAVLILASRLTNSNSIVIFLSASIQLLIYLPMFMKTSKVAELGVAAGLCVVTFSLTHWMDAALGYGFVGLLLCCSLLGPVAYSLMHASKRSWRGPWDTAQIPPDITNS